MHLSCLRQVDLSRNFHFKDREKSLPSDVVPIISANMDTIGTFEMAVALAEVQIYVPNIGHALRRGPPRQGRGLCPGGGVPPYKRLMGMCRWMGSHFHDLID